MITKLTLATGLLALAITSMPIGAAAAMPQSARVDVAANARSPVQQVHYRRWHHRHHRVHRHWHHHRHHFHRHRVISYCAAWRHECAARWGWGTRGFYRCLWRHGC